MRIYIAAKGLELTGDLEKYAHSKLARLNRKLPRKLRAQAGCEVLLGQRKRGGRQVSTCEIMLSVGENLFTAKESTQHIHAALDVAAAHVEQQVKQGLRPPRRWLARKTR